MTDEKKELNENELDKVTGGARNFEYLVADKFDVDLTAVILDGRTARANTNCPMTQCCGSSCPAYDSCTQSIKR